MVRYGFGLAVVCAFFIGPGLAESQYGCNPYDRTFVAYKLSAEQERQFVPAQEGQFRPSDTLFSSFWATMLASQAIDYIHLTPQHNAWDTSITHFSSDTDAQMWVYMAYGDSGMYLYCRVIDNNWIDYQLGCEGEFCCISDLPLEGAVWYFDPVSPRLHSSTSFNAVPGLPVLGWTKESAGYIVRFGGAEIPTFFAYNFYDSTWDTRSENFRLGCLVRVYTFTDADLLFGIKNKIKHSDGNSRRQEWRIPWRAIGNPQGTPVGSMPACGTEISGCFGYTDVDNDATMQSGQKLLRTGTGDLFNAAMLASGIRDSWSTILFGPMLDSITAGVRRHTPLWQRGFANPVSTEYFNLTGKRLNAQGYKHAGTVVIRRQVDAAGARRTDKIIVRQ